MTALETSICFPPENFWAYVFKLMRLNGVTLVSGFKRANARRKLLSLGALLLIVGVFIGLFMLTNYFSKALDSPLVAESGVNVEAMLATIPATIVTAAFTFILVTSFVVLLQALYLANDMEFLLAAPIPIRAVFLTKLLQAILPNFVLMLLFTLPILFSLGAAGGYHILYYPLVLVVLAFLALAATGITSLLVMAIVRFIPARRVVEMVVFFGAVFSFIGIQAFSQQFRDFETLTSEQIASSSGVLSAINSAWSPLAWGGRCLVELGEGRWLSGSLYLVLIMSLCGAVFWIALNTAEHLFYTGWASMQVSAQRKKGRPVLEGRQRQGTRAGLFANRQPSAVLAIMHKDFRLLRRDLRHLTQIVMPLLGSLALAFIVLTGEGNPLEGKGEAPGWYLDLMGSLIVYFSLLISFIVAWGQTYRLAITSFSMEGKNYWILKNAPLSASKLLTAKFLLAYLPSLTLSWLFLIAIALIQKAPAGIILYGCAAVALFIAGLDGINLALGVLGANFNWTDPRRMTGMPSGYAGVFVSLLHLIISVLLFFGAPVGLPLYRIASESVGQLIGLFAGGTFSLLCTFVPLVLVKERVYKIGEE